MTTPTFDTSTIVATFAAIGTAASAVGAAYIVTVLSAKAWKYIRAAL